MLSPGFALYLDVHAAIRLQAGYQLLPILLVALYDGLLFAHADRFDLVARDALADDLRVDRRLAFGLEVGLVEVEQHL